MPKQHRERPLILVADDDELIRTLIVGALNSDGFDTVEVTDGSEAVMAIQRHHPNLIILDIDMPIMDGFTACANIRAIDEYQSLPIVIVTGNEDTSSIGRAFDVGATDFISKPVNWSLLGHRMRYILRSASLRDEVAEREAENDAILSAIPDRVLRLSADGDIIDFTHEETKNTGINRSTHERGIATLFPPSVQATALETIANVLSSGQECSFEFQPTGETQVANGKDSGDARYFEARVVPHSDSIVLTIIRDVTASKADAARIEELAFFDELTGLPNRHHFLELTQTLLANADSGKHSFALSTIAIDRFKRINDNLGHEAGDRVLATIADRIAQLKVDFAARGMEVEIARLGADQFALIAGTSAAVLGPELPNDLLATFQRSVHSNGMGIPISASIGLAHYPRDGQDIETLLNKADKALFTAKRRGRSQYCQYFSLHDDSSGNLLQIESELKKALERDQLRLQFQPKFDLRSGRVVGAEALIRWNHPQLGNVSPGTFIPLAEESGLISEIDQWVINTASSKLRDWRRAGHNTLPLSINLSGREFCYAKPEASIQEAIEKYQIDPALLEIEITETIVMEDPAAAARTLHRLKAMGLRLAMDDFGTGYSSLSYLKNYPLDVLKIDSAFVKDLQYSLRDQALCRSIIAIAKGLGIECVAEGIETEAQREFLIAEHCDVAQGFALSRPLEEHDYVEILANGVRDKPKLKLI